MLLGLGFEVGAMEDALQYILRKGRVAVWAPYALVADRAEISATSTGTGTAGSIAVTALTSLVSRDSTVRTDASTGDGGNISV